MLQRREARKSLVKFSKHLFPEEPPALHHRLLCYALEDVAEAMATGVRADIPDGEWKRDRLLIFMPPGSAKSSYASVRFPAYFLGRYPEMAIISASSGKELATSFGRKVRNIIDSPEYGFLYNTKLAEDLRSKGDWATSEGGSYFACGVGSNVVGRRGDIGLIDDPVASKEDADSLTSRDKTWEWYISDFFTRLKPNAAQILIQTRWNDDDLSGRILPEDWNGESGDFVGFDGQIWRVICLPAEARDNDVLGREQGEWLWSEYFTPEVWVEKKKVITANYTRFRVWNAMYQQVPQPESGVFFKREWFKRFNLGEEPPISMYGASDYAVSDGKGDYTEHGAGGFDKELNLWFTRWWSGRTTPDVWIESQLDMIESLQKDGKRPYVWMAEVGVIRRAVEPFLTKRKRERRVFFRQEWMPHIGNKGANALAFQELAASGQVYVPRCQWGDDLIDQLVRFIPDAELVDDKVDVCGLFGRSVDSTFGPREQHIEPEKKRDSYGQDSDDEADTWMTM